MLTYYNEIFDANDEQFHILVVDDSAAIRAVYSANLRKIRNLTITDCADGAKAAELCGVSHFDAILVDYEMPGINGIELVRILRALDHFRTIPMIMVTATRDQTVKVKALEAGFNDFLAKPFDPVELRARVANMLVLSHLHKQLARATKP
jgi:putative two-component system response regulator